MTVAILLVNLLKEVWLPVVGYEGYYEVSNLGRVQSLPRMTPSGRRPGRILRTPVGNHGYPTVNLSVNGRRQVHLVHRLVSAAFLGPCPEGMECRHLDGVRTHCEVSNLEYGTHSQNQWDQVRHGSHFNASREACEKGHEFVPENTRIAHYPDGTYKQRVCLQCERDGYSSRLAKRPPRIGVCVICGESFEKPREHGKGRTAYCSRHRTRSRRTNQSISQ